MDGLGHELTRALRAGLLLAAALLSTACRRGDASPAPAEVAAEREPAAPAERNYDIPVLLPAELRLTGAANGTDGLLRTIEAAIAERDSARLQGLLVTYEEYRDILYPSFPAAHPPIAAGFETVWVLHWPDTQRGLRRLLREYGGKRVRILDLRFEKPDQDFVNFRLDEGSWVDLELDDERRVGVKLFGSVVRVGDQVKLLSIPD